MDGYPQRLADGSLSRCSGIAVDARLFHEARCRLVHRYRVYKDPFPHPALKGGVIPRLLSSVRTGHRPTHPSKDLRSSVGGPPGQVPADCYPGGAPPKNRLSSRHVSFAEYVTVLGLPMHHPKFLKWIGVPQSFSLLEMGAGRWLDTLSRDQVWQPPFICSGTSV